MLKLPPKQVRLKAHMTVEAAVTVRDLMLAGHTPASAFKDVGLAHGGTATWVKLHAALVTRYCVQAVKHG